MHIGHCAPQNTALNWKAGGQVFDLKQWFICPLDGFANSVFVAKKAHWFRQFLARHFTQFWHCGKQRLGITMLWVFENLLDRAFFHFIAAIHHNNTVSHLCHHGHVMGDKHHSGAGFAFQPVNKRKDFGLNGHIKRSGWFICNQQSWLAGQSHCDHHPLAHTARELMWKLL